MNHLGDANKMVGEDHIRDATKMVSDTPRTDAHIDGLRRDPEVSGCDRTLNFCRQLERELNAANVEIEEKRKDVVWLATEKAKLENYVMLLEEAGDALANHHLLVVTTYDKAKTHVSDWNKAKEDKL